MSANPVRSVFVVEPDSQGWIIDRLIQDVADELERRGISVRTGPPAGYAGEDVAFNTRYLTPVHIREARINAVFITHIDDRIREMELSRAFSRFDSFICISPHDAAFIAGLRKDGSGVIGVDLPPRNTTVRPARLGLFSAYYADGRKNERWILDYFESRPAAYRDNFVFAFLGAAWEEFAVQLAGLDLSYEIYRYRRSLAGEYEMYKERLPELDALMYLGFDGGAMSVYDAMCAGIGMIATDTSYHRGLGDAVTLIDSRESFFAELDARHARVDGRRAALEGRAIGSYVDQLLAHWNGLGGAGEPTDPDVHARQGDMEEVIAAFRSHYKPIGYSRLRSAAIRLLQSRRAR